MKFIATMIIAFIFFLAGWYSPELFSNAIMGSCKTKSITLYNEASQVVRVNADWLSSDGRKFYGYSSIMTRYQPGKSPEFSLSERHMVVNHTFHTRYLRVATVQDYRVAGPESSDHWPGAYIDPLTDKGYIADIYLFKTGNTLIMGYKNRPRYICQSFN